MSYIHKKFGFEDIKKQIEKRNDSLQWNTRAIDSALACKDISQEQALELRNFASNNGDSDVWEEIRKNSLILEKQAAWLKQDNPLVYVYGEADVDSKYLELAKLGAEELIRELGIQTEVKIIKDVPELTKILNEAAKRSPERPSDAVVSALKQLDEKNNYKPHFDIAITNRRIFNPKNPVMWGQWDPGGAIVSTNSGSTFDRVVKHEFGHDFGINYGTATGGNCSVRGCLMTITMEGPNFCPECERRAFSHVRKKQKEYSKHIFTSEGEVKAIRILGIDN